MLTTRKLQPLPLLLVYACLAASPSVARAQEPATSLPPWCQPPPAPPSPPSPPYTLCDSPSHLIFSLQWQALQYFYNATQGGSWVNNSGWADAREYNNNTCYLPFDEDNPFPSFCCWYGITCCMSKVCLGGGFNCLCSTRGAVMEMDLRNNNLVGPLAFHDWTVQDSVILEALACDLKIILLSTNSLTGTIPDAVSQMQSVEIIGFGGNQLEGTIPSGVGRLESLKRLDLTNNKLTGSLPDGLCVRMSPSGFKESVITDILVSGNSLTGLTPSLCPALVYLEANSNRLSGSMGTLGTFPELHILDLSNNLISGIVPTPEAWGELMISVNLQNNRMTGSLPENFSTIWYLTDLNVGGNLLNGTIPPSIFSRIGSLTSLNIAGNCSAALGQYDTTPSCITGTIPDKISLAVSLQRLNMNSLCLYGRIPDSMASTLSGALVVMNDNYFSCCGVGYEGECLNRSYRTYNMSLPRLPQGLQFSNQFQPYTSSQEGSSDSELMCPLIINSLGKRLGWTLDAQYFLFEQCYCVKMSYTLRVDIVLGEVSYACVAPSTEWWKAIPWIFSILAVASLLTFCGCAWLVVFCKGRRPLVFQAFVNMRKRLRSQPDHGMVSVVVTDIQGYSNLMRSCPALMNSALLMHNAVVRHCKWANFGFTVEQEGDSYTLVFYGALDAAMFCLQAQLMLMRQPWPDGLLEHTDPPGSDPDLQPEDQPPPSLLSRIALGSRILISNNRGTPGSDGTGERTSMESSSLKSNLKSVRRHRAFNNSKLRKGHELMFNGLRVRMGIATGWIPRGTPIRSSQVTERAKVVADAGAGGELLLDEITYKEIRDLAEDLGVVDHTGFDNSKLITWHIGCDSFTSRWKERDGICPAVFLDMGQYLHMIDKDRHHAMAQFGRASFAKRFVSMRSSSLCASKSFLSANSLSSPTAHRKLSGPTETGHVGDECKTGCFGLNSSTAHRKLPETTEAGTLVGEGKTGCFGLKKKACNTLQDLDVLQKLKSEEEALSLYQLLSPQLVGRAKVFGDTLALKEEWVMADKPFFHAPGALNAQLRPYDPAWLEKELEPVTIVSCMVDGYTGYATRHLKDSRRVHLSCQAVILSTLLEAKGGYLSLSESRGMRYVAVFQAPQDALLWAMTLQECLIYNEWPQSAIQYWKEEKRDQDQVLFRGPRAVKQARAAIPEEERLAANQAAREAYAGRPHEEHLAANQAAQEAFLIG